MNGSDQNGPPKEGAADIAETTSPDFFSRGKRIGIFVIAYNAERQIAQTLARIPPCVWREIECLYVIDDCSIDDTTACAIDYPDHTGKLRILRNRSNRRYGGNQKLSCQHAIDGNLDIVAMLHADGQYAPELLPALLNPLIEERADVVLGSRMIRRGKAREGGMPYCTYAGNAALTAIENRLGGMNLAEFHSGYRAYRVEFLKNIPFWENSDERHFDTQILFQARQADARIAEIPIPAHCGDGICRVNGIKYGISCIASALGYWLFGKNVVYSRKYDIARKGSKYGEKFDDPMSSHSLIWERLKGETLPGARILELGVGDAAITRRLHAAGAIVDGVEIDAAAAEMARPYCHAIHEGDLDRIDAIGLQGEYDIVLAADVLEHLAKPDYVLSRLKALLRRDGLLIVSLPNIANVYVRLNLLLGRFPTHSKGLLDLTHLHCYTLATMRRLLAKTGWMIESSLVTAIPLAIVFPFLRRAPWCWAMKTFHALTKGFRGLLAYQGILFCRNPNRSDLL